MAEYIRGITYNRNQELQSNEDGWKVFRANNIDLSSNRLVFDDIKIIDKNVRVRENQHLKRGDILICAGSGSREHIGKIAYIFEDIDYVFGGFMGVIRVSKELNNRYLFHLLTGKSFRNYLENTLSSSTINNLNSQIVNNFKIPIPPMEEQERIVRILDKFDVLTNSISEGLPREIALRRKQYEYYREQLLTF